MLSCAWPLVRTGVARIARIGSVATFLAVTRRGALLAKPATATPSQRQFSSSAAGTAPQRHVVTFSQSRLLAHMLFTANPLVDPTGLRPGSVGKLASELHMHLRPEQGYPVFERDDPAPSSGAKLSFSDKVEHVIQLWKELYDEALYESSYRLMARHPVESGDISKKLLKGIIARQERGAENRAKHDSPDTDFFENDSPGIGQAYSRDVRFALRLLGFSTSEIQHGLVKKEDIQERYREQCWEHHPDRTEGGPGEEAGSADERAAGASSSGSAAAPSGSHEKVASLNAARDVLRAAGLV